LEYIIDIALLFACDWHRRNLLYWSNGIPGCTYTDIADTICWRLSFHFLLSHQIAFAFHGESPLQVDHLPKAVFLTITAVFFCMAQPKFPTRAG
jgi:hypothetical protein